MMRAYINKVSILIVSLFMVLCHQAVYSQQAEAAVTLVTDFAVIDATPETLMARKAPWGSWQSLHQDNEEWRIAAQTQDQLATATFIALDSGWVLNDIEATTFFTDQGACKAFYQKEGNALKSKLKKPSAESDTGSNIGMFWQLKQRQDWGVWIAIVEAKNPTSQQLECAVKATLAFGADEYLSEGNEF